MGRVERDVELVRSRQGGELRWERARRLVAAEFVHTSSRLTRDQERGRCSGPAAALARGGPRRGARGRALRGGRLAGAVPLGARERRVVPRGARVRARQARAWRSKAGRAATVATSSSRACRASWRALVGARGGHRACGAGLPLALRPRPACGRARLDHGRDAGHEDEARGGRRERGVAGGRRGVRPHARARAEPLRGAEPWSGARCGVGPGAGLRGRPAARA